MKVVFCLTFLFSLVATIANAIAIPERDQENSITTPEPISQEIIKCPNGWVYGAGRCYYIDSSPRTHDSAESECNSKGGTLAIIRNNEEFTFIRSLLRNFYFLYVGASSNSNTNYTWSDGTPLQVDSPYWCKGYLWRHSNRHCALMMPVKYGGCLLHSACDIEDRSICELSPSIRSSTSLPEELSTDVDTTTQISRTECPSDWVQRNSRCYFIESTKMTHNEAQTSCQSRGGSLVVIRNDEEYQSIKAISSGLFFFQVGATASQAKRFKWSDGTEIPLNSSYWCEDQPNNCDGGEFDLKQGCLQMESYNSCFYDIDCDNIEVSVCEMSLSLNQTTRLNETSSESTTQD